MYCISVFWGKGTALFICKKLCICRLLHVCIRVALIHIIDRKFAVYIALVYPFVNNCLGCTLVCMPTSKSVIRKETFESFTWY